MGFRKLLLFALVLGTLVSANIVVAQTSDSSANSSSASKPASSKIKKKKTSRQSSAKRKPSRAPSRRSSLRYRRMHQAFIASTTLKPMAQQLLQNRIPAGYAGVEAFARKHSADDAGSLAWLAVGYARFLDHEYAKAIDPLSRARPHAGEIGDYVAYYLAASYLQAGRMAEGIAAIGSFDLSYPGSLLIRDAHVLYANALLNDHRPKEAVALIANDREPIRADLELALGRAYEAAGEPAKAVAVFRHLYFTLPLSFEADAADIELQKLDATPGISPPSFGDRRNRAEMLAHAKQYSEAVEAYRGLLNEASPTDKPSIQLSLASALRLFGQDREAKRILDSVPVSSPEVAAQRLFDIGEMQRAANHDDDYLKTVADIRSAAPTSPWLEQALLNAANIYLLRRDYDKTIDTFRELEQRFPGGPRAPYAHWKVAWLSLRQGRTAEAKQGFEQQIALYPDSTEVPAALYWRARLAEEDGDNAMATAYYQKISERFRNYYYGPLARERLGKLAASSTGKPGDGGSAPSEQAGLPHYAILDHIPPISSLPAIKDTVPDDNLRVAKARLLENGGLLDFSLRELRAAAEETKGDWLPAETARMYEDAGRYDLAVETLKRAIPNYFALDFQSLPRAYWEGLFPRPYWNDLKKFASANALDPYMVASLIRQESEFNPNAVSNRNALGLMQLLPNVGKGVAKQQKIKHFSVPQLFTPAMNLQLGTKYFRSMVDEFGGFEYALAAYNAGDDRVHDWQSDGKYRDVQEFVESIPFTQTREYVQAIMRNANVYRQLYGTP